MRRSLVAVVTSCTIAATSLGCASLEKVMPGAQESERAREVEELRQLVLELRQRATMAEVELERLRRQLAALERASPESVSEPAVVEIVDEPRGQLVEEVTPPRPIVPEAPEIEVLELADDDKDAKPISASEAATVGGDEPMVSEAGQALYDRGYTLFHQGRYVDAEAIFQQFLASFGGTDLGDNAQFWIGESRFARQDHSGALAAFREVVSRYPEGNKVPDALLKAADCLVKLGDLNGARKGYRELIERYPMVAAAAVAEDRMRELE